MISILLPKGGVSAIDPKWITMGGFVLLNSLLLVSMRACSLHMKHSDEYLASTVVVFTELMKLAVSLVGSYIFDGQQQWHKFQDCMIRAFLDDGLDILKLCLPAILYAVQNNLQYIIETAPLFQVLYQTKIVTTAIFFTIMLAKRLSIKEWCAIVFLAIGVGMVESSQHDILPHHASDIIGLFAVFIACLTSGFAGVYYEKVLKSSRSSIWIINIELSMMSFSFSAILAMVENPQEIIDHGVFKGFNIFVLIIVLLQALNGLGVAMVVKYSDNIHKGFLASLAIVLGILVDSVIFQDSEFNEKLGLGSFIVLISSVAYFQISSGHIGEHSSGLGAASGGGASSLPLTTKQHSSLSTLSQHPLLGTQTSGQQSSLDAYYDDDSEKDPSRLSYQKKWRHSVNNLATNIRQTAGRVSFTGAAGLSVSQNHVINSLTSPKDIEMDYGGSYNAVSSGSSGSSHPTQLSRATQPTIEFLSPH